MKVIYTQWSRILAFDWYRKWWPLNDLEWRNDRYLALLHRIPQLWGQVNIKCSRKKCSQKNLLFGDDRSLRFLRSALKRGTPLKSENPTCATVSDYLDNSWALAIEVGLLGFARMRWSLLCTCIMCIAYWVIQSWMKDMVKSIKFSEVKKTESRIVAYGT